MNRLTGRQVLECASALALWNGAARIKRRSTVALHDAARSDNRWRFMVPIRGVATWKLSMNLEVGRAVLSAPSDIRTLRGALNQYRSKSSHSPTIVERDCPIRSRLLYAGAERTTGAAPANGWAAAGTAAFRFGCATFGSGRHPTFARDKLPATGMGLAATRSEQRDGQS